MLLSDGNFRMPPSNADKRQAVSRLLGDAEWSAWSDREIAKQCHVTHRFVGLVRGSLDTVSSEESTQRTYTTKHGSSSHLSGCC
jgi:hypothetical protein